MIRILFVDDEQVTLDLTKEFLEQLEEDFRVNTALSAEEALERLTEEEFDVVVSDYKMSAMDGLEFLSELRGQGIKTPFIMFTGKGREEVAVEAFKRGADGYVMKGGEPTAQYFELGNWIRQAVSRRKAEEALQESEERFHDLVEQMSEGLGVVDADGTLTYVNKRIAEILEYYPEEIVGKHAFAFIDEEHIDLVRKEAEKRRKAIAGRFELVLTSKTGRKIPLLVSAKPILKNGEHVGSYALFIDISERKRMEKALRKSEERYRSLVELAHDGILLTEGPERTITFANRRMAGMLGYTVDELVGKSYVDLIHPDNMEDYLRERKTFFSSGKPSMYERTFLRKDGSTLHTLLSVSPVDPKDRSESCPAICVFTNITKRKRTENALKESERRLLSIIENLGAGLGIQDKNGVYTYVNPARAKMLGYKPEEMIGKPATSFIHKDSLAKRDAEITKRRKGESSTYELDLVSKDGGTVPVQAIGTPLLDEKGEFAGSYGLIVDLTERKKMEEEIREVQERFSGLYNSSKDAMGFAGLDGTLLDVNDSFSKLTGYSKEELLVGRKYQDITPKEYHEYEAKIIEKILRTGEPAEYEKEYIRKDGSRLPILLATFIVKGKNGKPIGVAAIIKDITERKKAEKALRESEERLRTILEGADDGVLVLQGGRYAFANRRACEMFGYPREELVGLHQGKLHLPPLRDKLLEGHKKRTRTMEHKPTRIEHEHLRKNGTRIMNEENRTVITWKGRPAELIFYRDTTERKKMEDREQFLHSLLSHDLRNKLQGVYGYLELLKRTGVPAKKEKYMGNIEEAVRGAALLIEKVGELRSIEEAGEAVDVDLDLAIRDAIEDTSPTAEEHGVAIEYRGVPHAAVTANPLLKSVFTNLIENSIKHVDCKKITITVKELKKNYRTIVRDDGKGIPKPVRKKLFERGAKGLGSVGSGLGLHLVKQIIDFSNGTILLKDTKKGTRFDIYLKKAGT